MEGKEFKSKVFLIMYFFEMYVIFHVFINCTKNIFYLNYRLYMKINIKIKEIFTNQINNKIKLI